MKKIISLLLIFTMMFSLCACSSAKQLTVQEVENEFETVVDGGGMLDIKNSGDKVKSFTCVFEGSFTEDLSDEDYVREAYRLVMAGSGSQTYKHFKTFMTLYATATAITLLSGTESYELDELVDIVCHGKKAEYNGWVISADVNESTGTFTLSVRS
ncbi:MAG: hypothetical protein IJW87_05085 [Clostridia bacterium]|nr:hypothetical protein [Clostridia bacterium]